jgi:hypothetical protein
MSNTAAARRAIDIDSGEQQRLDSSVPGSDHSRSMTPTTSKPWSFSNAAATDESTPPDIATTTLFFVVIREMP